MKQRRVNGKKTKELISSFIPEDKFDELSYKERMKVLKCERNYHERKKNQKPPDETKIKDLYE